MKWAPNKKLHLEVALIKAIQTLSQVTLNEVIETEIVADSPCDLVIRTRRVAADADTSDNGVLGIVKTEATAEDVDASDALAHERPYKEAWPLARAVEEIALLGGAQFDPEVARAFAALDHSALLAPIARTSLSAPPMRRVSA